jgi:AraC family transcriptional regulator
MSGNSMLARMQASAPGGRMVLFPKSGARLHAMVTSAGYDCCADAAYEWHGLRRGSVPYVLLQHTIAGCGRLRYGETRHELRPGQTMLLRFPHDNRYWVARGETWEFFWLCLNGREVLRIWRDAMAGHGPVVTLGAAAVERMAEFCLAVRQGEASSPARASAIAYQVAMVLGDELLPWGDVPARAKRPDAIGRVVSFAQTRPGQRLDVAALASAAGYSRHHFSRLFSASEGVSPARYVLRLRMEEAVSALRSSPSPIKTVAQLCGFADANYFAKVFRRSFGMSPRDFRRSGMFWPSAAPADTIPARVSRTTGG